MPTPLLLCLRLLTTRSPFSLPITGKDEPEVPANYLSSSSDLSGEDEEPHQGGNGASGAGAGGVKMPDPTVLFTAFMAAAQSMNIKGAISKVKEGQE